VILKITLIFLAISGLNFSYLSAQKIISDSSQTTSEDLKFKLVSLMVPTILIGYGIVGMESHAIKNTNFELKEEVNENIDEKRTIDDFIQHAPYVSVYLLNAFGVKGKNNFKNRTVILATSYLIMGSSVLCIKSVSNVQRPDGSSNNSFPSGHTATAFMGAEFLMQEYKDVSIWYGIAGYALATGTGMFRVYNDRHWVTDVVAGAGIGILSTKIAYWTNPIISNVLFKKKKESKSTSMLYPIYNDGKLGLGMVISF